MNLTCITWGTTQSRQIRLSGFWLSTQPYILPFPTHSPFSFYSLRSLLPSFPFFWLLSLLYVSLSLFSLQFSFSSIILFFSFSLTIYLPCLLSSSLIPPLPFYFFITTSVQIYNRCPFIHSYYKYRRLIASFSFLFYV